MPHKDKAAYKREYRKRQIPDKAEFIAVDGEGIEEMEGQKYALLSSSLHNPISRKSGLTTEECFEWLLSLKTEPRQTIVSFAFTYDCNKMLIDVPKEELEDLYELESCWFRGKKFDYRIHWTRGKSFTITQYTKRWYYDSKIEKVKSAVIWDTFGFFQGSFIKAIKEYRIPLDDRERKILTEGKGSRGEFKWSDIKEVTEYNHLECDLLIKLMENLQELLRGMDIYLKRWDGAGAIAAALMQKNGVKEHVFRGFSEEVEDAIMRAYFGGRSQCVQFGIFEGPIYHYDINSAYPSSYLGLPTLIGRWYSTDKYQPQEPYALYQVEWNMPHKQPLTPFPYRDDRGNIRYPHQGRGIYHAVEVAAAMIKFSKWIKVEKGWIFKPINNHHPFAWVQPFMNERLRLKKEGDLRHITMKLGANSIYGKTAQGITYGDNLPPYQSYFWAGMITAWSRAQLLKAGIQNPSKIIMFGTDAVFSEAPLNLPIGNTLGTWEDCNLPTPMSRFELYQPGLYRMQFPDEEPTIKTRGFHQSEVDFDKLAEIWQAKKFVGFYEADTNRFKGLQISMAQGRMDDWGKWVDMKRTIKLSPGGFGLPSFPERKHYDTPIPENRQTFRFDYIDGGKVLSMPFTKKNIKLPNPDDKMAMDIYLAESEFLDNPEVD